MKAMLSHEPGGPETLQWSDLPDPGVKKGHVLVRVHAAGVNFPDTLIIRDLYQMKPPGPLRRVVKSRAKCSRWAKGSQDLPQATGSLH